MDRIDEIIRRNIRGLLKEEPYTFVNDELVGKRFYHSVIVRGGFDNYMEAVRSVFENGLVPNDNGEVGSAIWFGPEKHAYNQSTNRLEVSLEYNAETKRRYELSGDEGTMFAHTVIPIGELRIECCPVGISGHYGEKDNIWSNLFMERIFKGNPDLLRGANNRFDESLTVTLYTDLIDMTMGKEWGDAARELCRIDGRFTEERFLL